MTDLQVLAELGVEKKPPLPAHPWLLRMQRMVFGTWEEVADPTIRCSHCGSDKIRRKGRKGCKEKFYEAGELQEGEVFRYICCNQGCSGRSFTHFPVGLVSCHRALPLQVTG